ncbi:MAG TPA: zf-HC2 domain-containing protein [Candidatus Methylomirabilis sp.]|nr:zf-HC2 domain-containing protein [Candidatus Methylomirabilis sp.]
MNCLSEEILRAYHDGELGSNERAAMESHVSSCRECRARLGQVSEVTAQVRQRLDSLEDVELPTAVDARAALARFQALHGREEERMPILVRMFARRWRLAWAAGVVAAILSVSLAFPSGRSLAQRLLATLRVEKVQPIRLDTSSFDQNRTLQQMLNQLISDKVVVTADEKSQKAATVADASAAAGFAVRVPRDMTVAPQFNVEGRHAFKMTIDRARMQEILDESGRPDLLLPATIDGETISAQMARAVRVQYGQCPNPAAEGQGQAGNPAQKFSCTLLLEDPSPVVNVPADLNLQQLAEIGLQLAGMSAVQAREFCQTVDWKSTLVLPIPPYVRSYETVTVDGVQGTLMTPANPRGPQSVLIWVKDGIIYSLVGPDGANETIALANSLD